jgi:hypothetical protein
MCRLSFQFSDFMTPADRLPEIQSPFISQQGQELSTAASLLIVAIPGTQAIPK